MKNTSSHTIYRRVKTPTILQMEAVECGAAALAIILSYYGKIVPLEELRKICGISRDGSKASQIVKAARTYGLIATGLKLELTDLQETTLPFIVFWKFNHFLVVEGFKKGRVYLNDPAFGPRTVTYEEFDKSFTGIVLSFEPDSDFVKSGAKKSLLKSLHTRLQGSYTGLLYVVLAGLALTITGLIIPSFSRIFVDDFLINKMKNWISLLLVGMAVTALLRGMLTWLQQYLLLKLQTKLTLTHSSKFFWHVLRLPIEFYNHRYAGDIAQRVDSNTTVAQLISGDLAINIVNILSIIFYAMLMFSYDVVLTMIGIIFASFNILALRYVSRKRKDENFKLLQERGKLMAVTMGGLQIIETLKATGGEADNFLRWSGHEAKIINIQQKLEVYTRILATIPFILSGLMTALILGVGGLRVLDGDLTVGMLVAFQSLMMSLNLPINNLVGLGSKLQDMEGTLARLDDVLQTPIDSLFNNSVEMIDNASRLIGSLELRDVTFGYSLLEPPLIENLNLQLHPGSRTAIVGATGSGKSTIVKLITGIQKPWSGEILFDGQPRAKISREVLTNSFAVVDQDIFMFDGSVWDNLTLWNKTCAYSDVIQAAKDASIHEIITNRNKGYESNVGERGNSFSGGECQRLEIARALTLNPSILILDEATASLDPLTEKMIDDRLRQRGCTCLIIAHRLSTIRDCDEILVMEQGKVIERGTHDQLCQQEGYYARLTKLESLYPS